MKRSIRYILLALMLLLVAMTSALTAMRFAIHGREVSVPKLTPERMDELLEVKLTRQHVLSRPEPLRLWAVLDEAALHRVVGGPAVMAAQLDRLAGALRQSAS